VRRGAPFGPFDNDMKKDISELRIIRTWRFDPVDAEFEVHCTILKGVTQHYYQF
jgi:protein TonB